MNTGELRAAAERLTGEWVVAYGGLAPEIAAGIGRDAPLVAAGLLELLPPPRGAEDPLRWVLSDLRHLYAGGGLNRHDKGLVASAVRRLELLMDGPDDDGEPVTADWLVKTGFGHDINDSGREVLYTSASGPALLYNPPEVCWTWEDEQCHVATLPPLPTRGHVRRLCTALGVPLAEGG